MREADALETVLVVVRPFGLSRVGDVISDPARMRDALSGEHARHVVRISATAPGRGGLPAVAEKEV